MKPSRTRQAQIAVLKFEAKKGGMSLRALLAPCNRREVEGIKTVSDPAEFADRVYGVVRRVESAAWARQDKKTKAVSRTALLAKELSPFIIAMRGRVASLEPKTALERAGKEFLLDRLGWALMILEKSLPAWGY